MGAGISYIDYYIPKNRLSIEEISNGFSVMPEELYCNSAADYNMFCKEQLLLTSVSYEDKLADHEMLGLLVEKMLDDGVIKAEEIDLIVFSQERYEYNTENIAQYIQHKYKLSNSSVFNISGNHCVNIEASLQICKALLDSNSNIRNILILSTQKIRDIQHRLIGRIAVLGDGAGLALVKNEPNLLEIIDIVNFVCGYFYDIKLKENNVLKHYKNSINTITKILKRNCVDTERINKVIIQNINPLLLVKYFEPFKIQYEKLFMQNIGKYGHLTCMDFLINVHDYIRSENLHKGELLLSFGMGWAGSYLTGLFSYK